MRRKIIQILFLTLCVALNSFAQEKVAPTDNQDSKNPIKVDEFGRIGECDLGARIDNFFITLNEEKSAQGYVIIYQGKDVLPADYNSTLMERRIKERMMFQRLDASRIVFVNGGFRDELATELFVVPGGAVSPEPTAMIPAPTLPDGIAFLYDRNGFAGEYEYDLSDEFILPSVKARTEEENRRAAEELTNDEPLSKEEVEENIRWNEEREKERVKWLEENKFFWISEKFGEIIKSRKDTSGVMIFYADDAYYDTGKLQKRIEEGKRKIVEFYKIPAGKIQVVYGGYRNQVQVEFWIVPKKGKSPTPTPEEKPVEESEN